MAGVGGNVIHQEIRIGDAARLLGVTSHTLRRWEKEGKFATPLRSSRGQRIYTTEQVIAFRRSQKGNTKTTAHDAIVVLRERATKIPTRKEILAELYLIEQHAHAAGDYRSALIASKLLLDAHDSDSRIIDAPTLQPWQRSDDAPIPDDDDSTE